MSICLRVSSVILVNDDYFDFCAYAANQTALNISYWDTMDCIFIFKLFNFPLSHRVRVCLRPQSTRSGPTFLLLCKIACVCLWVDGSATLWALSRCLTWQLGWSISADAEFLSGAMHCDTVCPRYSMRKGCLTRWAAKWVLDWKLRFGCLGLLA